MVQPPYTPQLNPVEPFFQELSGPEHRNRQLSPPEAGTPDQERGRRLGYAGAAKYLYLMIH